MAYSRAAAETRRKQEIERLRQLLEEGVQNYLTDERYTEYLTCVSRFHAYSPRNSLLILVQRPDATMVASYADWKIKFHRHVKAGEHGIRIIAPMARRAKVATPSKESDDGDGSEDIFGFRAVTVFDVAQTEGKPLPDFIRDLTASVPNYDQLAMAAASLTDFDIVSMPELPPDTNGLCRARSRVIGLRPGLSDSMALKTLIHEIAHSKLHPYGTHLPREVREIQAESVAYIVCAHLGVDTSDYTFGYLISWGAGDRPNFFKAAMPAVVETAREMIEGLDHYLELATGTADMKDMEQMEPESA